MQREVALSEGLGVVTALLHAVEKRAEPFELGLAPAKCRETHDRKLDHLASLDHLDRMDRLEDEPSAVGIESSLEAHVRERLVRSIVSPTIRHLC